MPIPSINAAKKHTREVVLPLTVGKTYTSSILTKEGTLLTVSKECLEYETYAAYNSELACGFVENHLNLIINHGSPAVSLNIIAMKFEEGLQQTLARQENGKWVLNDPPPNKALELLKCQRYYFRTDAEQYFPCSFFGVQGCCLLVPSPAPMRTTPSVNILKKGNVTIGSTSFSPSNVKNIITGMDASGIKLVFDFESNAPAQGVAVLTDWSFEFSADL